MAWATAQVHCYCSSANDEKTGESIANVVKAAIVTADTALNTQQGQGNVVLETKPKILFCDLRLSPGETRSCKSLCILMAYLTQFPNNLFHQIAQ